MSSDSKNTRTRILEATWNLMANNRGHGARMSDIAKATGISRQALYLHFDARADLLIATTRYMDEALGIEGALEPSRQAKTGQERMVLFISVMGRHFPKIQGMARALLAIKETDEEARAAWDERMDAIRDGCRAAIMMLAEEKTLAAGLTPEVATDQFWVMLSFESWDQLTSQCGWSEDDYIERLQQQAERCFLA